MLLSANSSRSSRAEIEQTYLLACERFRRQQPSLLDWSEVFRMEEGKPLDFGIFPFQPDIYRLFGDRDIPTVDVMKSGQCGISAAAVSLALFVTEMWQKNVLYVLPGAADAFDFSDSRVLPAIESSPYLLARFASGTQNKGLRRVGNAWLYFRGSVSEKKALSIPADVLILDEYDRLDQRNIPAFRKRLGAPTSMKLERRFSNPSLPELGIHALYLRTDQREWLVRCPACRTEAPVHYEASDGHHFIDEERKVRACGKCQRSLPREAIASGRWVPGKPGAGRVGLHVSKLIVPDQGVAELVEEHGASDEESLQAHYNFDLGLPYAPKGGSLSQDAVLACRRRYQPPDAYSGPSWVTGGVDVGRLLHVRISKWTNAGAVPLFVGEISTFEELGHLWDRFNVKFGLIDWQPEERKAREFMAAYPGRVMLTRWGPDTQDETFKVDEKDGLVVVRRTWAFDQTVAAFRNQTRLLPAILHPKYIPQVTAPYRIWETTMKGQKMARYISQRADHFFLAECYDLMASLQRTPDPVGGYGAPPESIRARVTRR